jgi:hypothetical protein
MEWKFLIVLTVRRRTMLVSPTSISLVGKRRSLISEGMSEHGLWFEPHSHSQSLTVAQLSWDQVLGNLSLRFIERFASYDQSASIQENDNIRRR